MVFNRFRICTRHPGYGATDSTPRGAMTDIEPVLDWAEDFEIFDDAFVHNPHPIWKDLREQGCPFARTERRQVSYMPTTFEAVRQVAGDTENFSSFSVSVTPTPTSYDDQGNRLRSIITSNAADHTPERRIMLLLIDRLASAFE